MKLTLRGFFFFFVIAFYAAYAALLTKFFGTEWLSTNFFYLTLTVLLAFLITIIGFGEFFRQLDEGKGVFEIILGYAFSPIFAPITSIISFRRKIKSREAFERAESYFKGATKERLVHRELKEWEKYILDCKYKDSGDKNYDLDRRAPVFRVQGKLVLNDPQLDEIVKVKEHWSIRGFIIDEDNFPDIRYKVFEEGEEVAVEFSPFSKWVWDVYKIVNGKRDWLMQLSNENFGLLKSGQIKVVPRAPYGTHRLEEIKRGDFITFNNMGLGVTVDVEVEYIKHYKIAEDLLKAEGVENVYPQVKSFEEAAHLLNSIENYYKRIQKGGIYAIRVGLGKKLKSM